MNRHSNKHREPARELRTKLVESANGAAEILARALQDKLYESNILLRPQNSAFSARNDDDAAGQQQITDKTLLNGVDRHGLFNLSKPTLFEVIRRAVAGDLAARDSYDNQRQLLIEQLPSYAIETILVIAQNHFARTTLLEKSEALMSLWYDKFSDSNRHIRRLAKSGVGQDNCLKFEPGYLDLWGVFPQGSPNAARELQQELLARDYRPRYIKPGPNSSSSETGISLLFVYDNPNPHGRHARDAAVEIISYVLKVRVFEDFMVAEDIRPPKEIKNQLIKSYNEPWDLLESARVRSVINLQQELQRTISHQNEELCSYLMGVFSSASNPVEEYRRWSTDRAECIQKAIHNSSHSQSTSQQIAVPIILERPWLGLDCKLSSLQTAPDLQDSKREREHVIKLCVLTAFSEDKAIRRLERGCSIGDLLIELQGLKSKIFSGRVENVEEPATLAAEILMPPVSNTKKHVLLWRGQSSVSSEISLIDRSVQLDIYAALAKLTEGNQGTHKKLSGANVRELKIPRHGALRIYYMPLEHLGSYLIVRVGNKSTQPNDITIAVARARSVRAESMEELSAQHDAVTEDKD